MKKRPIIYGILLILSIIFYCFTHCGSAKAEPYIGVETSDIPSMELPEWSFAPATPSPAPTATPTPGASETAAPGGEEQRSVDAELQATSLYSRQFKTAWREGSVLNGSGYTYYMFNGGGTAVLVGPDIVNFADPARGGHLQNIWDDEIGDVVPLNDLSHLTELDWCSVSATSVDFAYQSFVYAFYDVPSVDLMGDFEIDYVLKIPMYNSITIPSGAENIYSLSYITQESIKYGNVYSYFTVTGSEGTVIPFEFHHTISQFTKGIQDRIKITGLSSTEKISSISIMYVILPFGHNNFFDTLQAAFTEAGQTPTNSSLYGSWLLQNSSLSFQRIVSYTESRNLIEKILAGIKHIFIPDPNILQQTVISLIPTEHEGAASYVFSLRDTIQNLFSSTPHAIINVPQFDFKLDYSTNDRGYRVWNAYTFDVTEFFDNNNTRLGRLIENLRVLINVTITFAFVNSVFSMVCSIFGLHWYKGVEAEDVGEADV